MSRVLPLVGSNIWRNKRRSVLTVLGIAVAILVFAALHAVIVSLLFPVRQVGAADTLSVRRAGRANVLASRLPTAYEDRLAAIDGVAAATGVLSELAIIGDEGVHVFLRGVEAARYLTVQPLEVDEEEWQSFAEDRRAALVGFRLLAKMGWEIGDEIELPRLGVSVRVAGRIPAQGVDLENHMLVHREYLQVLRGLEGQVTFVMVRPVTGTAGGGSLDELAAKIDRTLATAPLATYSTSSAGFAEAVVEEFMGFIDYMRVMAMVIVVITMLGAANAIAMSVRERTREIGVMRALGYRPADVLQLILAESLALATLGGVLGLAAAGLVIGSRAAQLQGVEWSAGTVALAAVMAVLIGLCGGLVPAVGAARLKPVEALRRVD